MSYLKEVSIDESEPRVLVEGPGFGDTEFFGRWLLAAAKANAFWLNALEDKTFQSRVDLILCQCAIPDFGIGATTMLSWLEKKVASFVVDPNDTVGTEFVMMVEMGFFVLTGQRYQMVIPSRLTMEKVKRAAVKYAETDDTEFCLHPEYLIVTMPYGEANAWQTRLQNMDRAHRVADRNLLLG